MKTAYYEVLENQMIQCQLCPKACLMDVGECGACRCRCNVNGEMVLKTYGMVSGVTTESAEKSGLHFYSQKGIQFFSVGGYGCTLKCPYCRNAHISQNRIFTEQMSIDDMLVRVNNLKASGVGGVCYTFNEPGIWYEHVMDYARAVRKAGFLNVLDTNGYINEAPLKDLLEWMDLVNIDVKALTPEVYRDVFGGELEHVLDSIRVIEESDVYYEITLPILENVNDDSSELEAGLKRIKEIAPQAKLNLRAISPMEKDSEVRGPEDVKMMDLEEIARKYFEQVHVTLRADAKY